MPTSPLPTTGGILGVNSTAGAIGNSSQSFLFGAPPAGSGLKPTLPPTPAPLKGSPSPLTVSSTSLAQGDIANKSNFINGTASAITQHQNNVATASSTPPTTTGPTSSTSPTQTSPSQTSTSQSGSQATSSGQNFTFNIPTDATGNSYRNISVPSVQNAQGQWVPDPSQITDAMLAQQGATYNPYTQTAIDPTNPSTTPSGTSPNATGSATGSSTTGSSILDQASSEDQQFAQQQTQAYQTLTNSIAQIQNGTFPLNPLQQAQISNIQQTFQSQIDAQSASNGQATALVTAEAARNGVEMGDPVGYTAELTQSVNAGIAKITSINSQMVDATLKAQQGFQTQDYQMANDQYTALTKLLDSRQTEIDKIASAAQAEADKQQSFQLQVQTFQEKQQQDAIDNQFKQSSQDLQQQTLDETKSKDAVTAAQDAFNQKVALANSLGYWTDANGNKISTQAAIKDAQDALNAAQTQATAQEKNNIDAANDGLVKNPDGTYSTADGTNLGITGNITPQQLGNLTFVHTLQSGGMYFDRSELPKGAKGDAIAKQYAALGIPQVPDATTRTALDSVDTASQNVDALKSAIDAIAPKGITGSVLDHTRNLYDTSMQTGRGDQVNNFNSLRQVMFQAITSLSGTKRIMPAELDAMQKNIPTATDTADNANAKIAALTKQISDARNSLLGGKVIYTNLSDYTRDNPLSVTDYKGAQALQAKGATPDEVLQWLQQQGGAGTTNTSAGGFNQPPSTGEKGSASSALVAPASERNPSKVIGGYDFTNYATDPNWGNGVNHFLNSIPDISTPEALGAYIQKTAPNSPFAANPEQILSVAKQYNVNPKIMVAIMKQESNLGTLGRAARTHNPANVGNVDSGSNVDWGSWQNGLTALAENINKRYIS